MRTGLALALAALASATALSPHATRSGALRSIRGGRTALVQASTAASPGLLADARAAIGSANLVATYLEINSWLLSIGGVTILLDPVLEGPLDFGLPNGVYSAVKRKLPQKGLVSALPEIDLILLSQGLDDHAHDRTLCAIAAAGITAPIVAPPSAKTVLARHFPERQVRFLSPGGMWMLRTPAGGTLQVRATTGALVGPPWQARENGYILRDTSTGFATYYEPHVEFNAEELAALAPVDAVITPVSGQGLPGFDLVHNSAEAAELCSILRPRWVIPMANGDIDASGVTAALVRQLGSAEEFERLLAAAQVPAEIAKVTPGQPLSID